MTSASSRFQFFTPVSFFEKANAAEGFRRRIGGLVSTEGRDKEGETILQRGLDFSGFLEDGWYNDNHSKLQTGVLGYPDHVQRFKKGDVLPDGGIAPNAGTWAEGYLLEGWKPADEIWALGQALKKTQGRRRLGFSIEGTIQTRTGPQRKTIAKAKVQNVAITHCPVNPETGLAILVKSLRTAEEEEKALSAGTPTPGSAPLGPRTGAGAGQILMPESLESDVKNATYAAHIRRKKKLTKSQAVTYVLLRHPNISATTAGRIVDAAFRGLI